MPVESTSGLFGKIEGAVMVSSLPQTVPTFGSSCARVHQRLNEIRQQQHVGIQRQNPLAAGERDGLILRGGETDVLFVVERSGSGLRTVPEYRWCRRWNCYR